MAILLIKCPHTRRPTTGIEIDPNSFATIPDVLSPCESLECGLEHACRGLNHGIAGTTSRWSVVTYVGWSQ